jgi:PEP-CTERM motif
MYFAELSSQPGGVMGGIRGLVACGVFAMSTAAAADTIQINWNSPVFNPASVNVGTVNFPGGSSGTNAGRFEGTASNPTGALSLDQLYLSATDFFAYCHDLAQTLTTSTYTVNYGASATMLDFLGAVNSVLGGGDFAWLTTASSTVHAAIQLGIWEAKFGDDFVLNTGTVNVNLANVPDAVEAQFAAFVAQMGANSTDLDGGFVMVLTNPNTQDVITGHVPPGRLVPEPGTLLLLGFAAAAAGLARRRRH